MAQIVNCPHGFERSVEKGLNQCIEKWIEQFEPKSGLFIILNRFAISDGNNHWVFERPTFFSFLAESICNADEAGLAAVVALIYTLEPLFLPELAESGCLRLLLDLLGEVPFGLFMPICEFIALALADLDPELIPTVAAEREIEAISRVLESGDTRAVLKALELLMTVADTDPDRFRAIFVETGLPEVLQTLSVEKGVAGQHADVLGKWIA
jgi:hypothetical protein